MAHKIQIALLTAAFLGVFSFAGSAQQATLRLGNDVIELGEQLRLSIEFTLPGGWPDGDMPADFWPVQADTLTSQVEIIDRGAVEEETINSDLVIHQELIITSFDTGYVVIPPLFFELGNERIESNALLLQVTLPLLDERGLRSNKALREVKYTWFDQLMEQIWYIVAGLIFILVLLVWLRFSKRSTKGEASEEPPEIPRQSAHLEALEALEALRRKELWQKGEGKAYYTELTDILRNYIERRYAVNTLERTTREIIADLKLCGVPSDAMARLKATLELADVVKFAKYAALSTENEQAISNAELIIRSTLHELTPHE